MNPQPSPEYQVTQADMLRIEKKLDDMANALQSLIRVEVHQTNQAATITRLESELSTLRKQVEITEKNLDRWITRGITVWSVAVVVFTMVATFYKFH